MKIQQGTSFRDTGSFWKTSRSSAASGNTSNTGTSLSWWKCWKWCCDLPDSRRWTVGKRPRVPGGRERTQREDELQRQVEDDSAQGPVVRAKKAPSALRMDEWDGQLAAGDAEYRGWCPFCVAGKGKSEPHRRIEASRDRGHPELHLDCCYMGREAEDRASPILVGKFSKDGWLVNHPVNDVIMSVQSL